MLCSTNGCQLSHATPFHNWCPCYTQLGLLYCILNMASTVVIFLKYVLMQSVIFLATFGSSTKVTVLVISFLNYCPIITQLWHTHSSCNLYSLYSFSTARKFTFYLATISLSSKLWYIILFCLGVLIFILLTFLLSFGSTLFLCYL